MKLIQLDIVGLSNSQTQSGAFALVLGEIGGNRRLPIVIGNFEAKAIAIAMDNEYKSQRPITHDLFKTLADGFKIIVKKVVIICFVKLHLIMPILAPSKGLSAETFYASWYRALYHLHFFIEKKVVILRFCTTLHKYANIGGIHGPLG